MKLVWGMDSREKNRDLKSDQNTLCIISLAFGSLRRFDITFIVSSLLSSDFFSTPPTRTTIFRSYL